MSCRASCLQCGCVASCTLHVSYTDCSNVSTPRNTVLARRAKQESMAAASKQAEAEERAQQEAEAAAAAEAAAKAAALQALLAVKQHRLPQEPADGEAGSLQVVVRLPTGNRKGRRFRSSDPLQAVFDFVDVECAQQGGGGEAGSSGEGSSEQQGGCGIKPGSYRLVSQFPRKVLMDSSSSLQDVGIITDTALFVEPL